MTLTIGEKFERSESKRGWLEQQVVEDIARAVAAPPQRFKVAAVQQGSRDCLLLALRVYSAGAWGAGGGGVGEGLSALQLAHEIQRQVADPLSPLRSSASLRRVMHAHLQDSYLRLLPPSAAPATTYGAPPTLTLSTDPAALPCAPPPVLGQSPQLTLYERPTPDPSAPPIGTGSKPPSPEEVPMLEDLTLRLFAGMTAAPSDPAPTPHPPTPPQPILPAHRPGHAFQVAGTSSLMPRSPGGHGAVWMASERSGGSSPLSVMSASSRANDDDCDHCGTPQHAPASPHTPDLPPTYAAPGLPRFGAPFQVGGVEGGGAHTVWTSPPSTHSSLGLAGLGLGGFGEGGEGGGEAGGGELVGRLRAAGRALEESERSRRELRESARKQGEYIVALKGLSIAQAREVESLTAKNEVLNAQLREARKKGKETALKRKEMKGLRLSQSFGLEQELHAERNRAKEMSVYYQRMLREAHEREHALFLSRQQAGGGGGGGGGGVEEGGLGDEAVRRLLERVADLEMQLLEAKGQPPDTRV